MKKTASIVIILLALTLALVEWRVAASEESIKQAINSIQVKGIQASVDQVHISPLSANARLLRLKAPIDSLQTIQVADLSVDIGFMNMLRFMFLNPKNAVSNSDSYLIEFDGFVLSTPALNLPIARSGEVKTNGAILSVIQQVLKNELPKSDFLITATLKDVNTWQENSTSNTRKTAAPLFDKLELSASYNSGLTFASISVLGTSNTNAGMHIKSKHYYTRISKPLIPERSEISFTYTGIIPSEIPIPSLPKSWFKASDSNISLDLKLERNTLVDMTSLATIRGVEWQAPSTWPPALAPAYFVFGSNPKTTPIDSIQYSITMTDVDWKSMISVYTPQLSISSDIYAPKMPNSSDNYRFDAASIDIHFKTLEMAKMAQNLQVMMGYKQPSNQVDNKIRLRLRGTLKSPALTVLN